MLHWVCYNRAFSYAFGVNLHFLSVNIKDLIAPNRYNIWNISDCEGTRTHNHLSCKQTPDQLAEPAKWLGCILSTYICGAMAVLINSHINFKGQSTLCNCLNLRDLLVQRRNNIWNLSNCNGSRTHYHLVRKRTLNYLDKLGQWLSCFFSTYLLIKTHSQCNLQISIHYTAYLCGQFGQIIECSFTNQMVCGFESLCSHLNFRYCTSFEQAASKIQSNCILFDV